MTASLGACPSCGKDRTGFLRYCRGCGFDFEAHVAGATAPARDAGRKPSSAPTVYTAPDEPSAMSISTDEVPPRAFWTSPAGGPRPPRSRRWLAGYFVAGLVGVVAIGNALGPSGGTAPAPTDEARDPTSAPLAPTEPPPAATGSEPTFAPTGDTEVASLLRVVDGDTIRVLLNGQDTPVRYIGIDTPEPNDRDPAQQALADAAMAANAALLDGHDLILERDVSETDSFGRLLRYVWVDDGSSLTLVNQELVRQGLARATSYPPDVAYDDVFAAVQEVAQSQALGFWAAPPTELRLRRPP